MSRYGFGVDVGGTTCKLGLFLEDGTLLEKWEIRTNTENHGESILEDIAQAVEAKMAEREIVRENIIGVGIGVPGPVLDDGTVKKCVNLGWDVINVSELLGRRLWVPVKVGNDANVAALGEMWLGGGKGFHNVIMVTLGTGVGGGVVLDGKILAGTHGAGGEIGHIKMRDEEPDTCGCGGHGCLEQYASATGIVRLAKQRLAKDDAPSCLRSGEVSAKVIFDGAKAGDTVCVELAQTLGWMLGTACANIACVVDPEVFVIGGGVSRAGAVLLDAVAESFQKRCFHACSQTQFALATLGNDAGIYGCMKLVLGN